MSKMQDDAVTAQPEVVPKLVEALVNDQSNKGNSAAVPQNLLAEDHNQPLPSPTMETYAEAVNEFTRNATAFIEQLPLLTKAQGAYEEAMRAITEIRKVLDAGEENLRTLMTQLEQRVNVHGVKPTLDKKNPEPAKVERMRATNEGGFRWP